MEEKICSKCQKPWPTTEFYSGKQWKDGLHPWCKICFNAAGKARYQKQTFDKPMHHRWNHDLVRHSYFSHLDTPMQAYLLGFLAADGNVLSTVPRISIELSTKDQDLLTLIRDELAPGHSIRTRRREKGANRFASGESATLAFTSLQMVTDLALFGIVPKKSRTIRWPSALPLHLASPFLLGYFDGDGNITQTIVKETSYPIWHLTSGSINFLHDIISIAKEQADIAIGGPYPAGSIHTYFIRVTGKKALLLDKWLHIEGLGLTRKRIE